MQNNQSDTGLHDSLSYPFYNQITSIIKEIEQILSRESKF